MQDVLEAAPEVCSAGAPGDPPGRCPPVTTPEWCSHTWQTFGGWGVILGVSRCHWCSTLATAEAMRLPSLERRRRFPPGVRRGRVLLRGR